MHRHVRYHCGLDVDGDRHWQLRPVLAVRHCRGHARLVPRIVWMVACGTGREVWRNGFQQRRCQEAAARVRADRVAFLTTLNRPPLVSPLRPF